MVFVILAAVLLNSGSFGFMSTYLFDCILWHIHLNNLFLGKTNHTYHKLDAHSKRVRTHKD